MWLPGGADLRTYVAEAGFAGERRVPHNDGIATGSSQGGDPISARECRRQYGIDPPMSSWGESGGYSRRYGQRDQ